MNKKTEELVWLIADLKEEINNIGKDRGENFRKYKKLLGEEQQKIRELNAKLSILITMR